MLTLRPSSATCRLVIFLLLGSTQISLLLVIMNQSNCTCSCGLSLEQNPHQDPSSSFVSMEQQKQGPTALANYSTNISKAELYADIDPKGIKCGCFKCFLPSKSDPSAGWVLTENQKRRTGGGEGDRFAFDIAMHSWDSTQALVQKYQFRHFSLGSPALLSEDDEAPTLKELSKHMYSHRRWPNNHCLNALNRGKYPLVAQKVQRAPVDAESIHCLPLEEDEKVYTQNLLQMMDKVANKTLFAQQFKSELKYMQETVFKDYPRLYLDLQILVDSQGLIYHFDLDRAIQNRKKTKEATEKEMRTCQNRTNVWLSIADNASQQ